MVSKKKNSCEGGIEKSSCPEDHQLARGLPSKPHDANW